MTARGGAAAERGDAAWMKVTKARFEDLARKAFAGIPRRFRDLVYNVVIAVKASPGPEAGRWRGSRDLLGLYVGPPRSGMISPFSGTYFPARIILYQHNIQERCSTPGELERCVRDTLRHELAHHFGFSDEDLRRKWPEGA